MCKNNHCVPGLLMVILAKLSLLRKVQKHSKLINKLVKEVGDRVLEQSERL